jgi:hypothetical protein
MMMAREIRKQILDLPKRAERATQFLVMLTDLMQDRMDPFETSLVKLITDEYIEIYGELNSKRGK